jgi:ribosomal protein S6--L-glutamate ligase
MKGTLCINDPEAKFRASSKFLALQILNHSGIPIPPTFLTGDSSDIQTIVHNYLGLPLVVKTNEGTWGMGVELAQNVKMAHQMFQKTTKKNRMVLFQKYLKETQEQDIRAFVLDGRVIAAMRRISRSDDFRANIHQGGKAEGIDLPKEYAKIAIFATKALGLEIAGVDILETKTGPLVLEVNPSPGLEHIETTTNIDIATQIVEYLEMRL